MLILLAILVVALDFADILLTTLVQASVPAMWWNAGAWLIPAVGSAIVLNDPARSALRNIFPARSERILLFLFVFSAGILVPLYFPGIGQVLRVAGTIGGGIGLAAAWTS